MHLLLPNPFYFFHNTLYFLPSPFFILIYFLSFFSLIPVSFSLFPFSLILFTISHFSTPVMCLLAPISLLAFSHHSVSEDQDKILQTQRPLNHVFDTQGVGIDARAI